MLITSVSANPVRSLKRFETALADGLTAVHGPNGVGKTNLLESLYFALTGRSFRTADRRELIPFGEDLARAEAVVTDASGARTVFTAAVSRQQGRRHLVDGNPVDVETAAESRPHVLVFAPERIAIVKGPPGERRAHLDAFAAARRPAAAGLRRRYGQALAQRNAILARIAAGQAAESDLDAWDKAVARAASPLVEARAEAIGALGAPFGELAGELGLGGDAAIRYQPSFTAGGAGELVEALKSRREQDLRSRRTGAGPHRDEVAIELSGRSLRRYGSQGQQRAALLALLFAEREALQREHATPLLLLDDVMSELDRDRRARLGRRLAAGGQSLVTAAEREALPLSEAAAEIALDWESGEG